MGLRMWTDESAAAEVAGYLGEIADADALAAEIGEPLDEIGHGPRAPSFTRRVRRRNGSRSAARSLVVRTNA